MSVADVQAAVRDARGAPLLPAAGTTKPGVSRPRDGALVLDVSDLRGIVAYDPAELTFTAGAATPVAEVVAALGEHGQYLPFDPPLAVAGATLGGTVAAGVSGPNALRHGGVRDFVIDVRFVDGTGTLVGGGAKVVKNAAGFDLPKLFVGSMGRLGVMTELSFKVFPAPRATTTLAFALGTTGDAVRAACALARGPLTLDAVDVTPGGELIVRLGGDAGTLDARARRVAAAVDGEARRHDGDDDAALWHAATELTWVPADHALVRVGVTPRDVAGLEPVAPLVRYSLAANVAWVAWPPDVPLQRLSERLAALGRTGMVLRGDGGPLLGRPTGGAFGDRVRRALDPDGRFPAEGS